MSYLKFHRLLRLAVLSLGFLTVTGLPGAQAQRSFEQDLPSGFSNTIGSSGQNAPFNNGADQVWQYQYDSNEFAVTGPMMINEIYFRPSSSTDVFAAFNFSDVEVTLAEAATDVAATSATFAANIHRGLVVRSGVYQPSSDLSSTGSGLPVWVPLRLQKGFLYDPSQGRDFVIQIRICSVTADFGLSSGIDHAISMAGRRSGHTSNCTATTRNLGPSILVPIIKIDYTPLQEQALPSNQLTTNSNASTAFPVNTTSNQTWQWHYDSTQFLSNGPITITEISLRADNASSTVAAFDFSSFEVKVGRAATDYQVTGHVPTFASNFVDSKVVRSGRWRATATQPSLAASSTWISLQLEDSYVYDPSLGDDFIIEIRSCAPTTIWGVALDAVSGTAGANGGNRYGHNADCNAATQNFNNNELVPVVKISFVENTVASLPFVESFDHYGAQHQGKKLPPAWSGESVNVAGWRSHNSSTGLGTALGDHSSRKRGVGFYLTTDDGLSVASNEVLNSPWINLAGSVAPLANFWVFSDSPLPGNLLDQNRLTVEVQRKVGNTIQGTLAPKETIQLLGHGCWTRYALSLNSFANDVVRLRFSGSTDSLNGSLHDLAIDDFSIFSSLPEEAGQAPRLDIKLDINSCSNINGQHVSSRRPGPYYASAKPAGEFNVFLETIYPFQPLAFWAGPRNIAVATFGFVGQMDTGTPDTTGDGIPESIFVFGSGLNLTPSFNDLFYFTDIAGEWRVSWQLYPFLPLGMLTDFQAVVATGQGTLLLTNSIGLEIVEF